MRVPEPTTLAKRADLDEMAAESAAAIARYAESWGHFKGADTLRRLARRCRVEALKLRARAEADRVRVVADRERKKLRETGRV